ncbi:MAG TPA: molybdopterin-dependent oxidoreductase [Puia sp.]|nr:molybdopterin-dependent oxidoreductase [Puia sp.]
MENNESPLDPSAPPPQQHTPGDPRSPQQHTPGDPTPPGAAPARHPLRESFRKAIGTSDQLTAQQQINRRTFVSFAAFFVLGAAAWKSWFFIKDAGQSDGVQGPLRKVLNVDDRIFGRTFSPNHLAPTFPKTAAARNVRYNSGIGLGSNGFDLAKWALDVRRDNGDALSIGIDELRRLPKTEIVYEFKCIEGWSQISWWGGVKFSDFAAHYDLRPETAREYVGLATPDDRYYIGIDMPSALHPQTILAYEMNGQPLPVRHGAPLRLIIPVKYGVKHLKRVGRIFFSDTRPRDYWFERGYDYSCSL